MSDTLLQNLKATKDKYKKQLLAVPNVEAVGVGPQVSDGKLTGKMAIKIFIRKKIPLSEITKEVLIPSELDGFPTDIEELSPLYIHKPH